MNCLVCGIKCEEYYTFENNADGHYIRKDIWLCPYCLKTYERKDKDEDSHPDVKEK